MFALRDERVRSESLNTSTKLNGPVLAGTEGTTQWVTKIPDKRG
jgi:hypothetical protein